MQVVGLAIPSLRMHRDNRSIWETDEAKRTYLSGRWILDAGALMSPLRLRIEPEARPRSEPTYLILTLISNCGVGKTAQEFDGLGSVSTGGVRSDEVVP